MRRCTGVVFFLFFLNIIVGAQEPSSAQPPEAQQQPSAQQQQPPTPQPSPSQQPSGQQQAETPNASEPQEMPETPEPAEPRSTPRWELFAGYSHVEADPFSVGTRSPLQGWQTNVTLNVARWLGFVADFGGSYGTENIPVAVPSPFPPCPPLCPASTTTFPVNTHLYTYLFGARLPYRRWDRFVPFAELLYGRAHVSGEISGISETDTKGAYAGGLGVDFGITQRLAWRVQGDYLRVKFFGLKADNYRLSTGIVLHWTHKKKRRTLTTP